MYCRRESRFVQNLDVRRQTGGPRGVTHQGNTNANERLFTVLKDIFDVSGSDYATTVLVIFVEVFINVRF